MMEGIYTFIRQIKHDLSLAQRIFFFKDFSIKYLGLTESGMEVYLLMTDTFQYPLRYDRGDDTFYQQEWVKIDEMRS